MNAPAAGSVTPTALRIAALTAIAMFAFAANSLLCRLALAADRIDAATFTAVRIAAGALMLGLIMLPRRRNQRPAAPDWRAVAMLFGYMAFFSFAYLSLAAGTGALLLFGAVQMTMFFVAIRKGEFFDRISWAGLALAFSGLVYLVSPGLSAPDPAGAVLMALAGIAWGAYSLRGRAAADPLAATAGNFIYSVPLAMLLVLVFAADLHVSWRGAGLAALSGAFASALGYVVWYAALRGLTRSRAAIVQLSVPVIASFGGVLLLSEDVTLRLLLASAATLGGVALVLTRRAAAR